MSKVNNKDIWTTVLSLLLTLNIFYTLLQSYIVNFDQVNAGWDVNNKFIIYVFSIEYISFKESLNVISYLPYSILDIVFPILQRKLQALCRPKLFDTHRTGIVNPSSFFLLLKICLLLLI